MSATPFWSEQADLKDLFSKLIDKDDSINSLWDVFTSYEMIQSHQAEDDADTSEQWLAKQAHIIKEATATYFAKVKLNEENIVDILDTIAAISEGEAPEEQGLEPEWSELAGTIVNQYLADEQLSQGTLYNFLDAFEQSLLSHNKQHILVSQQQQLRDVLESQTNLSEELKRQLLNNLERSLDGELSEELGDDEQYDEPQADWPRLTLAYSTTFFSDKDGGNIDCDEREATVRQKFEDYKSQVTDLLNQSPASDLQPLPVTPEHMDNEKALHAFYDTIDENNFFYVLGNDFSIWQSDDKVFFLYLEKEDKELPYEIVLGGMLLADYQPMLDGYNSAVGKLA